MAPVVIADQVWKRFRRGERHDSLRDLLMAAAARLTRPRGTPAASSREVFWALKGASFTVAPGEAVGLIGPNGAGKSTVLKLLTRIMKPTSGVCAVRGRVGALIEVAAGFHPDLTGRENVYLQGAVMGMRRAEIAREFDAIVAFSELDAFIDTPVKRYSSGMHARLGFAIAAHLFPDVLVVDEVLSVGDAAFQERCMRRMSQLIASGVAVLFVSHNLPAVLQLCSRAILLERGELRYDGAAGEAIRLYHESIARPPEPSAADAAIAIRGVELLMPNGRATRAVRSGAPLVVRVHYEARRPVPAPHVAVDVYRADGVYCCGINSRMADCDLGLVEGCGAVELELQRFPLLAGCYTLSVGILDTACVVPYDLHDRSYPFSVVSSRRERGLVAVDYRWRVNGAPCGAEPPGVPPVAPGVTPAEGVL